MFHVVVVHPEIPPNTGNIIRMCANTGAHLHLVEPLGFDMSDAALRRAGLDYHELTTVKVHRSWSAVRDHLRDRTMWAFATSGTVAFHTASFEPGCALVFGCESSGLPPDVLGQFPAGRRLRIPMRPGNRSLNLSNAVAVAVYEAWHQNNYGGATEP